MSALDDVVRRASKTIAWQRDVDEASVELARLREVEKLALAVVASAKRAEGPVLAVLLADLEAAVLR